MYTFHKTNFPKSSLTILLDEYPSSWSIDSLSHCLKDNVKENIESVKLSVVFRVVYFVILLSKVKFFMLTCTRERCGTEVSLNVRQDTNKDLYRLLVTRDTSMPKRWRTKRELRPRLCRGPVPDWNLL